MEQKKLIKDIIKEQQEKKPQVGEPDLWEALRFLKHTAELFNSRLEDIPTIKNSLADIADRLQLIENCLKNKGFLDEKVN